MDSYVVLRKVGTGSYGSAYLVCSKQDHQQYVLKKIQPADIPDKERQVAWNEVEVLSKLNHPFVLGYIHHFTYKQQLCIITDYCEHGDLHQYMQRSRQQGQQHVPEQQALTWFVQMVLALQHVHSHSMLHRDLKTQNLFLTAANFVKLGDFGIARSIGNTVGMANTLVGTPYYMSPEVLQNLPYDYQSDMWSAGCVLYEMLSSHQAFDAPDFPGLLAKIVAGAHQPMPTNASNELQVLIKQLLSSDPQQRPSCDSILAQPFLQPYVAAATQLMAELQGKKIVQQQLAAAAAALASYVPVANGDSGANARLLRAFDFVRKGASKAVSKANVIQQAAASEGRDALDTELQAAVGRLRALEAQREAIREQLVLFQQLPTAHTAGGSSGPSSRSHPTQLRLSPAAGDQQTALQLLSPGQQPPKLPARSARSFTGGSSSRSTVSSGRPRAASQSQVIIDSSSSAEAVAGATSVADTVSLHQLMADGCPAVLSSSQATCSRQSDQGPRLLNATTAVANAGAAAMQAIELMLQPPTPSGTGNSQPPPTRHVSSTSACRIESIMMGPQVPGSCAVEAAATAKTAGSVSARSSRRQLQSDSNLPAAEHFNLLGKQLSEGALGYRSGVCSSPEISVHNGLQPRQPEPSSQRTCSKALKALANDPEHPADELQSVSSILSPGGAAPCPEGHGTGQLTADICTTSDLSDISSMSVWVGQDDPLSSLFSSSGSGCSGVACEDNDSSGGSSGLTHAQVLKARREARKAEELKRHDAELEQTRSSYRQERVAAAARASSVLEGSPGNCIVPPGFSINNTAEGCSKSQPVGQQASRRSSRSQIVPAVHEAQAAAQQEGSLTAMLPAGVAGPSPVPGKPPLAGRRVSKRTMNMPVPGLGHVDIAQGGLRADYTGADGSPQAVCRTPTAAPCAYHGDNHDIDEEDIDHQLAAIAALRKANNAFRSPAVARSPTPGENCPEMGRRGPQELLGLIQRKKASSFDLGQHGPRVTADNTLRGVPGGEWKLQGLGRQIRDVIKANHPERSRHSVY